VARSCSWLAHGHAGPTLVLTYMALGGAARLASAPVAGGRMEVLTIGSRSRCEGDSGGWSGLRGDGGLGRPCDDVWQSSGARVDGRRRRSSGRHTTQRRLDGTAQHGDEARAAVSGRRETDAVMFGGFTTAAVTLPAPARVQARRAMVGLELKQQRVQQAAATFDASGHWVMSAQ
jgi:hypothetical protein